MDTLIFPIKLTFTFETHVPILIIIVQNAFSSSHE